MGQLTAIGGALYAHFMFFISPDVFNYQRTVFVLMSVVFGGVETLWGAILDPGLNDPRYPTAYDHLA